MSEDSLYQLIYANMIYRAWWSKRGTVKQSAELGSQICRVINEYYEAQKIPDYIPPKRKR